MNFYSLLFLLFLGIALVLLILYKLLLGRTAPKLTHGDLLKALSNYPNNHKSEGCEKVQPTTTMSKEDVDKISKSFEKGMDFQWLSDENMYNTSKPMASFVVTMSTNVGLKYGHVLELRDDQDQLQGYASLAHPGHSFKDLQYFSAMGFKKPFYTSKKAKKEGWGEIIASRMDEFAKISREFHDREFKNKKHWYILIFGVVGSAQGKGIGKKLLDCVCALAYESGHPIYLECHDGNVSYYEKRGFRKLGVMKLKKVKKKGFSEIKEANVNGMIWENKKKTD
ncbi:acetyltransferase [Anaeramoeba flamelloides]|uniref:Acetyltransferase n=1 Tax=Anaeramoeba flamelloides TaxID=1746091 RepID=A0ABQ8XNQ7_9EUKA|nr:acetyltransferase [Anaeramoeba flamelloides]